MAKTTRAKRKENGRPNGDERYKTVDVAMKRFGHQKDALLQVLNTAQETFGSLSEDLMAYVADQLHVPLSQVYGVATFYHMFTFETEGEHRCMICTDPICAAAGAEEVLEAATHHAGGKATVQRTTCLGLCDQAPAALVDGTARVNLKADAVDAIFSGEAPRARLQVTGEPRVMTRLIGKLEPTDLDAHRAEGAFEALKQALTTMTPGEVIERVKAAGLAGRGGAGFPTGLKWQFTRSAPGAPKYVICNFDESEPGTFKDRAMVEGDPFRVIEGAILCGYAIDAVQGYVFVRGEYPEATRVLQAAIDKLYGAGLLGEHILDTDFSFDLAIRRGAGAYICGEETALFEAIEGKQGFPRIKPPFPTTHGVFNKPTSINNVETLAIVPDIVARGGEWLRQWGTEKSTGVKLFCLSGHVKQPGVIEAPFGLTVRELIERHGGGFDGEPLAILMGGAAGGFLPPAHFDTPITNETLNPLKAPVGSGAIMVFNQSVDLLDILKRLARFFVHESCGKCVPCRVGTTQIEKILDKIANGNGTPDDLTRLKTLGKTMQQICLCGLGMSAPNAVLSALHHFQNHSVFTALA